MLPARYDDDDNIITFQPRGPYLPLSRGGSLVALVGVCIV